MEYVEYATHVIYARSSTGSQPLPELWASRSRRWLEWACNGANAKGNADYFWWVGPAPERTPVTAYRGETA